jgi:hypothetical protein
MNKGRCKGCGKDVLWSKTKEGKNVPLDPKAPVYRVAEDLFGGEVALLERTGSYVSHFATCPKADNFSASNRRTG